jgi:hypothetical protein
LQGRGEDALVDAREAVSLAPSVVKPRYLLAAALGEAGRWAAAAAVCNEALRLSSSSSSTPEPKLTQLAADCNAHLAASAEHEALLRSRVATAQDAGSASEQCKGWAALAEHHAMLGAFEVRRA